MDKYKIVYYNKTAGIKYAIATNTQGKYGILSGYETIDIDTADFVFKICGVVCPFIYDFIRCEAKQYYNRTDDFKYRETFELYILRIGRNEGLFSTLYGTVVLKPIPREQYIILGKATTEGLVGCIRLDANRPYLPYYSNYVFLNCNGEEVIALEKGWKIEQGFQSEEATVYSDRYYGSLDKQGNIKLLRKREANYIDDDDSYELEKMYRDAFENDPGAEWNID